MDHVRFDAVAREVARKATRRQGIIAGVSSLIGGAVVADRASAHAGSGSGAGTVGADAARSSAPAFASDPAWASPETPPSVCRISAVRNLQSLAPGTLIGFEEITPEDASVFPANGRVWRVRYVSTGRDNSERTLVCGIVAAPADPATLDLGEVDGERVARMAGWTHGTLGITARCEPSNAPELEIWGPPPFGIGAVGWGAPGADGRREWQGSPEEGILGTMLSRGWIVTATDYQNETSPGAGFQPYIIGKVEAANALDNLRAAHHLLSTVYGAAPAERYDAVIWGHSQGGHSAMWTGQLFEPYMAATAQPKEPKFALRGVAVAAAASNLITAPEIQPDLMGFGLFDWTANKETQLTGVPVPIKLAPMLFSYVVEAWQHWSAEGSPDPAAMPAYPDTGVLDPSAVLTPLGMVAAQQMSDRCWVDGAPVVELAMKFTDTPFLHPSFSDGEISDGVRLGGFDRTCATSEDPATQAWCAWLRYQRPGPLGTHDMAKVPMQNGRPVPLLIAHGADDEAIHCVTTTPAADVLPQARDCVSVRLYDSLLPEYCPEGAAQGSLQLVIWNPQEGVTVADHSDVTGLMAAAPGTTPDMLRFEGSLLEQFFTAAFAGTVEAGCSAEVMTVETGG